MVDYLSYDLFYPTSNSVKCMVVSPFEREAALGAAAFGLRFASQVSFGANKNVPSPIWPEKSYVCMYLIELLKGPRGESLTLSRGGETMVGVRCVGRCVKVRLFLRW